ncbi:hypothetical protein ACVWZ6_001472 [Bradyrhizobium sp. GM6.1]
MTDNNADLLPPGEPFDPARWPIRSDAARCLADAAFEAALTPEILSRLKSDEGIAVVVRVISGRRVRRASPPSRATISEPICRESI